MAFVKEFRKFKDEMPEWEYFNSLGIRKISGMELLKHTASMVVDRERNYYLECRGLVWDENICQNEGFYTLILDGMLIELRVIDACCSDEMKIYRENHWYVKRIDIINEEIKEKFSKEEIFELVREAFVAESTIDPEIPKKRGVIEIVFEEDMEMNW